jgi:hypothetical protein
MVHVGQCLTVGLIPVAVLGFWAISEVPQARGLAPVFVAGLVCLFVVGIGMFVWRHCLAINSDPNEEDVGARTLYGRSRDTLLSEQEAQDVIARAATAEAPHRTPGASTTGSGPGTGPDPREPQASELFVGCGVWLLLIIGGIVLCSNYWGCESERKAPDGMSRPGDDYKTLSPSDVQELRQINEEMKRSAGALEEELRRSKDRP